MSSLYQQHKLFFIILIICIIGFLAWYFSQILICILIAGVISIIGFPVVDLLERIHYKKIRLPHVLNVFLTLILILAVVLGLLSFFIPLVVKETSMVTSIDWQKLLNYTRPDSSGCSKYLLNMELSKRMRLLNRSSKITSLMSLT